MIYECAKPVIIDIVGAHSTGKDTTIEQIKTYYNTIHQFDPIHVPSVSRTHLKDKNLKIYGEVDDLYQSYISLMNWSEILSSVLGQKRPKIVLSTDLVVRSLGYALAGAKCSVALEQAHKKMLDVVFQIIGQQVDIYWIYIPIEFPIVADGVRDQNENYRMDVDKMILYVLRSCKLPFYTLRGTVAERKKKIETFLGTHIHKKYTGECVL